MNVPSVVFSVPELLGNTGPVARIDLAILLLFSLFSWAIIFQKWGRFRRLRRNTQRFLRAFYKSNHLREVHVRAEDFRPAPVVEVFESGYEEMERQLAGHRNLASVTRSMQAESTDQASRMEARLPWLATTAAASPFIGLFGTVWGIIDAFFRLGSEGAATLRAVAPGISEALITTAAGLFAAIPALIAYNIFLHQLREVSAASDELALEFANRADEVLGGGVARPAEYH